MSDVERIPELRPEILFLFDLVRQLRSGRIRIPRFQRAFVWRRDQMVDLLDSINRQYPVGSLLAWETSEPIASLASLGPLRFDRQVTSTPVYILDGHQRLSTITGALVGQKGGASDIEDASRWSIVFNARDERFEHIDLDTDPLPFQFPMWKILETVEFLRECERILASEDPAAPVYVERAQSVARAFQNYKIPLIRIRDTGITEAVEIFARLNSKGQAMTADQMVSALLYREGESQHFDLAGEIDESMARLGQYNFGDIDRTAVLRALLAAAGEDIYRTDWTQIAKSRRDDLLVKLRRALPSVNRGLEAAARFLRDELGVMNSRLLPYVMQLVTLAAFFYACDSPTAAQLALLRQWFWWSSFGGWFGTANPSRVNAVVREMIDVVAVQQTPVLSSVDLTAAALPIPRSFDMRSARTRVLLLVLLSLRPLSRTGTIVKSPDEMIVQLGPEALGYIANTVRNRELYRSPANRIVREAAWERGQAKTWLLSLPEDGLRDAVCLSHGIPPDALNLLKKPDASEFVGRRLSHLQEVERRFMTERAVMPPKSDVPSATAVDSD